MRLVLAVAVLALAACASCPAPKAPSGISRSLTLTAYGLAGTVDSLLAGGKLAPQVAIRLNAKLQRAESELRAGQTATARRDIDAVKAELP